MPWDRDKIVDLLLEAGAIARGLRKELRREKKADLSLVTQADREVEDLLTRELEAPERGAYLIGEETVAEKGEDYIRRAFAAECFIVDPIDGTSPYAHGLPTWGISVGRMVAGRLEDGAVYLPEFGELVVSDGASVLEGTRTDGRWHWRELAPATSEGDAERLVGITQAIAKYGRADVPNPVQVLGAAVVPLVGLLQGRFSAYLGSVKVWDIAGSLPLILRHGFAVSVVEGGEVRRVDEEVGDRAYILDPANRRRWSLRSDLLVCRAADEARLRSVFHEGPRAREP